MSKQKIKACPFCGGEGKHLLLFGFHDYHCDRCGCSTKSYMTEQDAFNAWNKRASDAETLKMLAEIEAELFHEGICKSHINAEKNKTYPHTGDCNCDRRILQDIINKYRKELQGE